MPLAWELWLFATPWTVAHLALLPMGTLQGRIQEWVPCPPPGDLHDPGMELTSLDVSCIAKRFLTASATLEATGYPEYLAFFHYPLQPEETCFHKMICTVTTCLQARDLQLQRPGGWKCFHCCRNQAPHSESWRTQVYYAGGPQEPNSPSSEPKTKGLQSFYTSTGMIKRVCRFAGARAIAKNRTRVSEINSSS